MGDLEAHAEAGAEHVPFQDGGTSLAPALAIVPPATAATEGEGGQAVEVEGVLEAEVFFFFFERPHVVY